MPEKKYPDTCPTGHLHPSSSIFFFFRNNVRNNVDQKDLPSSLPPLLSKAENHTNIRRPTTTANVADVIVPWVIKRSPITPNTKTIKKMSENEYKKQNKNKNITKKSLPSFSPLFFPLFSPLSSSRTCKNKPLLPVG